MLAVDQGVESMLSEDRFRDLQCDQAFVLVGESLENERKVRVVALVQAFHLATSVVSLGPRHRLRLRNAAQFRLHQVDELLVRLDARAADHDFVGTDVVQLEALQGVGVQVFDVVLQPFQRQAQARQPVGSLEDLVRKMLALLEPVRLIVGTLVLFLADLSLLEIGVGYARGGDGPRLQRAVSHHVENVHHVVRQAVRFEVRGFLVVLHVKFAPGHLHHPVVHL